MSSCLRQVSLCIYTRSRGLPCYPGSVAYPSPEEDCWLPGSMSKVPPQDFWSKLGRAENNMLRVRETHRSPSPDSKAERNHRTEEDEAETLELSRATGSGHSQFSDPVYASFLDAALDATTVVVCCPQQATHRLRAVFRTITFRSKIPFPDGPMSRTSVEGSCPGDSEK